MSHISPIKPMSLSGRASILRSAGLRPAARSNSEDNGIASDFLVLKRAATHRAALLPKSGTCLLGCALMIFVLALAGCDREQIKVQQVPKESGQTAQMPMM